MTETQEAAPAEEQGQAISTDLVRASNLPADQVGVVTEFLAKAMPEEEEDPSVAALAIVAQVLSADTPEEVLADVEAEGVRQRLEEPFLLTDVSFRRSEYEAGMPFYVLMRGTDTATGEGVLLTTGSQKITAQVFRLLQLGALPRRVVVRQAKKPSRSGYYPLRLVDDTQ